MGYFGTLGYVNGASYLVDLAFELKSIGSTVKILIVGDGAEKEKIISYAKEKNVLGHNIFLEEPVPKNQLPSIIKNMDAVWNIVLDNPVMFNNSANKFFDSLAAGKPIFINHGGWMEEFINNKGCGKSLWKNDYRDAAFMIDEVLNNKDWLYKSSDAASQAALNIFEREKLFEDFYQVIKFTAPSEYSKLKHIGDIGNSILKK